MQALLKTITLSTLMLCTGFFPNTQAATPPNVIFILTDDLSMNLLAFMPNVQAMQKDGMSFSNYFVTDSLCCPSRTSIFTGKLPHNDGVITNSPPSGGYAAFMEHNNEEQTFAVALQKAGYRTAMLGKYLNGYLPSKHGVPKGWDEWYVAGDGYREFNYALNQNGRIVRYGSDESSYLTDVVSKRGVDFIHRHATSAFFIEIATFAPHGPYVPAPRDIDKFPGLTVPHTPAYAEQPDASAPEWLKAIPALTPQDKARLDSVFRKRAQSVQAVDKMIGDLRATLVNLGLDKNTYVIFSSDNGFHLGEYSLRAGKQTAFDTDIHVPLIIVGPGIAAGSVSTEMASNIDLCPTLTELGGQPGLTQPDGHSLVSLLHGQKPAQWRQTVLIEHKRPTPDVNDPDKPGRFSANPPTYHALRSANAVYIEYEGGEKSYYDLEHDPFELKNIVSTLPEKKLKHLHEVLKANRECQGTKECWAAQQMAP